MTRQHRAWLLGIALGLALGAPSAGQEGAEPPRLVRLEDRGLGPTPAQLVALVELQRAVRARVPVRWDPASGCPREVVFSPALPLAARAPDEVVAEVVDRLRRLYGWTGAPGLFVTATDADGPARRVIRLEQRVERVPVEGGALRLVIGRVDGRLVLERVVGRVYRDLPPALAPLAPLPPRAAPRLGPLTIADAGPRPVVTPRPHGVWRPAHAVIEVDGGAPRRVLRDGEGRALWSEPLACGAGPGTVHGRVFPTDPRRPAALVPIGDVRVQVDGGPIVVTDPQGRFAGASGALPFGLDGPLERVVPHTGAVYPRGAAIVLDGDPLLREVNVFHHLVRTRRFFAGIAGVPGLAEAANRTTVAVVGVPEQNAAAGYFSVESHGQRFDHPLFFGGVREDTALDAGVITHERGHALLHALGFGSQSGGDAAAIHEGLSDYLAAARLGTPRLYEYALGFMARRLDELRVYPQDKTGSPHETGLILAGALWDARRELGAAVDGLALAAIRRVGGGATMRDVAQAVVDAGGAGREAALRRHFVRHGLLDPLDAPNHPPEVRIELSGPSGQQQGARLLSDRRTDPTWIVGTAEALAAHELHLTVTDPEGKEVTTTLSGLEGSSRARREAGQPIVVSFTLPVPVGDHMLTVTAQDEAGELRVRTVRIHVSADDPDLSGGRGAREAIIRAPVGQTTRAPVAQLAELDPDVVVAAAREPGLLQVVGPRSLAAEVVGTDLVVRPQPGEEGVHALTLLARTQWIQTGRLVHVTVIVGDDAAWIHVASRGPVIAGTRTAEEATRWVLVAPGQAVTARAGEALELRVEAVLASDGGQVRSTQGAGLSGSIGGPPGEPPAPAPGPALDLVEAPPELGAFLSSSADEGPLSSSQGGVLERSSSARTTRSLWLTPPPGASARYTLVLEATTPEGEEVRREVEVLVLPAPGNRPPAISAPARAAPGASFEVGVSDPDGDEVALEVVGGGRRETPGGGHRVDAPPTSGALVLVATDAHGARAVRRVVVGDSGDDARGAAPEPPRGPGLVDRLERAR
ncbi:MAG: hypothetical protein M9894_03820 [Planctomycetes bacterium]|nr:hypothetical protein [Planctomycetota bacterium]